MLPLLLSCASAPPPLEEGDRLWRLGEHRRALEAYQRPGASAEEEARLLLRQGLLRAMPESEVRDEEEARRLLAAVVERFPDTLSAREAGLALAGLEAIDARRAMEGQLASLQTQLAVLREQDRQLRAALALEGAKAGDLVQRLRELQTEGERLRAEVGRLRTEIDQLKAIDLEIPPGG
jgi:TolA-binding protein